MLHPGPLMASEASSHFLQFRIQYSSIALLYFDYALTFADEVVYMWCKPFRLSTFLYICCRYALVANVIYLLAQANKMHSRVCDAWYKFDGVISVLGRAAVIVTLTLRTWAVHRADRRILYMLVPLGITCVVLDIVHVPGLACIKSTGNRTAANVLSIGMVVFEWSAAILTGLGTFMAVRVNGKWKVGSATLHGVLFRQGLIYFCYASMFTVTAVVLNFTAPDGSLAQRLPNALNLPISCLLTARLLLQIREAQDKASSCLGSFSTFNQEYTQEIDLNKQEQDTLAFRVIFAVDATLMDDFGDDQLTTGLLKGSERNAHDAASADADPAPSQGEIPLYMIHSQNSLQAKERADDAV